MLQEDILKQNEIKANRITAIVMWISVGIYIATWILFEIDYFVAYVNYRPLLMTCIILLVFPAFVCRHYHFEPGWVKYVLSGALIAALALTMSFMTFYVTIFMVVPMVVSVRYFSVRYTKAVTIVSIIVFLIAYLYGANHGILDMNMVRFRPGATIRIIGDGWLDESTRGVAHLEDATLYDSIFMSAIRLLPVTIVAITSVWITKYGRNMMLEQVKSAEESTRVSAELDLAKKIQADMLPSIFPAFPDRTEFDLYASMDPAREVGGDFYDFFLVDDDHLAMLIADVSGKGVPAAMFMMVCKNIVANNLMLGKSPGKALTDTNRTVCKNNSEEMFFTIWAGVLEISTGRMKCANAGHEYPVLKRGGGAYEIFKDIHGMAIGWLDDVEYREYELMLSQGDRLFVYTDGVTEAAKSEKEMFGKERIEETLNKTSDATPEEMIKAVKAAVDEFSGDNEQFDDITMLALSIR